MTAPKPSGIVRIAPPTAHDVKEAAWAIVKNSRDLTAHGHGHAVSWARDYLGLEDRDRGRTS